MTLEEFFEKPIEELIGACFEARIEALEKKVGIYKSVPEEPIKKRWRAEPGGKYFFASETGRIFVDKDDYTEIDNARYDRGMYFKAEEELELYDKKWLITQKIRDIALRLGEPTKEDWKDVDIDKYYLTFNLDNNLCCFDVKYLQKAQGTIYCLDINFKDVCLDEIGVEDLKLVIL